MLDMAEEEIDLTRPPWLHLVSAFHAMEPPDVLISLSRICGQGSITERVQSFIWHHCISKVDGKAYASLCTSFLKKLIVEVESAGNEVLDEVYEQLAFYMSSLKSDDLVKGNTEVMKQVSFIFPDAYTLPSSTLKIHLNCSLNMLKGDTGCSIWPASLFLSEFILTCPELFSMRSCFELGSGVGLVGICLAHVKASKVILSDGDLSTLANLKLNLELNQLSMRTGVTGVTEDPSTVQCIHLPWECTSKDELQDFMPDIVLGADVIYDPTCIPHLVRVLAALLEKRKPSDDTVMCQSSRLNGEDINTYSQLKFPLAYIASVIRNNETFSYFLKLAEKANLKVIDITPKINPSNLLPYMLSYERSSVRLLVISYSLY